MSGLIQASNAVFVVFDGRSGYLASGLSNEFELPADVNTTNIAMLAEEVAAKVRLNKLVEKVVVYGPRVVANLVGAKLSKARPEIEVVANMAE